MAVYTINPLTDRRWSAFIERHPKSSIFHHTGWLAALWKTYGHKPLVLTTSAPGEELHNGLAYCEVKSWLTGKRLVSLPFSDYCDPLADSSESYTELLAHYAELSLPFYKYAAIRPLDPVYTPSSSSWTSGDQFVHHKLVLEPPSESIFKNLHKNCIQRKIKRAESAGLEYMKGRDEKLLQRFYELQIRTRRRHRIPPQPLQWFRNLLDCLGDRLTIRVALHSGKPVAAILTLAHKYTVLYKYGCSDERFNSFGGMPFLFWKAIQEEKNDGMRVLDLGRSDTDNTGLIQFKDRLGAERTLITYWMYRPSSPADTQRSWLSHAAHYLKPCLPSALLRLPRALLTIPSNFLYRHMD
jgi:CelD/BcsL family acetyltransferase involved in cellulose biosynthesis